jgi:hypothetical protein
MQLHLSLLLENYFSMNLQLCLEVLSYTNSEGMMYHREGDDVDGGDGDTLCNDPEKFPILSLGSCFVFHAIVMSSCIYRPILFLEPSKLLVTNPILFFSNYLDGFIKPSTLFLFSKYKRIHFSCLF